MSKYKILITLALAAALSAHAHTCPEPAILDAAYTQTGPFGFGDGLLAVKKGERWGFVDRQGRLVIPADFEETEGFAEGKAAVKLDGYWGVIDTSGKFFVRPRYKDAGRYYGGLMPVSKNGKNFIGLDSHGREVDMPTRYPLYEYPHSFYGEDGTIGYKDRDGNIVVPAQYERGEQYFSEGMAAVRKNGLWGFIDAQGIERIAPRYTLPPPKEQWNLRFHDGLVKVVLDGESFFIDQQDCIILKHPKPMQNE